MTISDIAPNITLGGRVRPFFFDYLVYGSADPILQDFEKKKNIYLFFIFFFSNFFFKLFFFFLYKFSVVSPKPG